MGWGLGLGLLILCGLAFASIWGLETRVVQEARAETWRYLDVHLREVVKRFAAEEFRGGEGTLERFGSRLVNAVAVNPAVVDVAVLAPGGAVVNQYTRGSGRMPCLAMVPRDRPAELVHPAGQAAEGEIGCMAVPIFANGDHKGAVVLHTLREVVAAGRRAGVVVKRTAQRLAPVFVGFYLLLGGLLIAAQRAARGWRARAATADRIEALGAIADGINHEIRNPLNGVSLSLEFLARKHLDEETREVVTAARRQARRIGERLDEFARFTRVLRLETREVDVRDLVQAAARAHGDRISVVGEARAYVDPGEMAEALDAVVGLLAEHGRADARIRLTLSGGPGEWSLVATGETVELDADAVERLFDPYVRTRPRDIGRGLAFARAVFQAHGGELRARRTGRSLTLLGTAPTPPPGEGS